MIAKTNDSQESTEPSNLISLKEAQIQLDNFKKAHPGVVGNEYALRGWISLQELENYIQFVKKKSIEKGIDVNGIDFIFTQHKSAAPGKSNLNNMDYDLSFMYAPTFNKGSKNIAFDPLHSKKNEPAILEELLVQSDSREFTENGIEQTAIGNRINCCPNMCS